MHSAFVRSVSFTGKVFISTSEDTGPAYTQMTPTGGPRGQLVMYLRFNTHFRHDARASGYAPTTSSCSAATASLPSALREMVVRMVARGS